MVEADAAVQASLGSCVRDVPKDRVAARDRLGTLPRPERIAEGEHVRIRADSWIAEQIPGPADRAARLEDGVRDLRTPGLQVAGGTDAGQAGPDDQDVDVLTAAVHRSSPRVFPAHCKRTCGLRSRPRPAGFTRFTPIG
jgi:hypothetical protein